MILSKNVLLKALFIFSNFSGGGVRVSHCESLLLFYLFYSSSAPEKTMHELLPGRDARSVRRCIECLTAEGYVERHELKDKDGTAFAVLTITEKGTNYCLDYLNRSDSVIEKLLKTRPLQKQG